MKQDGLVFFGSAKFSLPILEALLEMGYQPRVITEPDKPAGRGRKLCPNPVKKFALDHQLKILEDYRDLLSSHPSAAKASHTITPFGILAAYGKILPLSLLEKFPLGILNFHPSLLPKYRGASPIPAVILAGEKKTGVTIIKLTAKVDAGPIIAQEELPILKTDTTATLTQKLAELAAKMAKKYLPQYLAGKIQPVEQEHSRATFTGKISKEDGRISWEKGPVSLDRQIRAYNPWPGAFTEIEGQRIIFWESEFDATQNKVVIRKIQVAGKKPISGKQFAQGYRYLLTKFPAFVIFKE